MLFNSLIFWIFFAVVLLLYRFLPHRKQNTMLLLASYLFYGWWDWRFLVLIWISTLVDYLVALKIHAATQPRVRRTWLLLSLVTNLGILGFFKYFDFFADSLAVVMRTVGVHPDFVTLNIVLPVGISFYTFQTMSYTIEVYRGTVRPRRNLRDLALYVAFFPQLVAGPIERAGRLLPQIETPRKIDFEGVRVGAYLCLWGLFKKVVLADNLGLIADRVYSGAQAPSMGELAVGTVAFAFQIYCDFSGYSDIARGLARLMGFELMRNFNIPYMATDPSMFWRRWHISLSTWLRDYLYIPLGGNRLGNGRTYFNLMATMTLGGLWHGASWLFVFWGVYHGAILIIYRLLGLEAPDRGSTGGEERNWPAAFRRGSMVAVMFVLVCGSWVLFRAPSAVFVVRAIEAAVRLGPGFEQAAMLLAGQKAVLILVALATLIELLQHRTNDEFVVFRAPAVIRGLLYTLFYFSIVFLGTPDVQPFIYFQF